MVEVLIAGAGPAGSVAALVLARAGVRVLLVDRSQFPRHKLCGDTVNPGTMALLQQLGLAEPIERRGLPLGGMLVTNEAGFAVDAQYAAGMTGRAISRRELDAVLLEAAAAAGARVELGARVVSPIVDQAGDKLRVRGAVLAARGRRIRLPAAVTIAADGRRSTLAFGLGLARHPVHPRRWAVGAYFTGVTGMGARGEMHLRRPHYIGVSAVPDDLVNACVVTPAREGLRDPESFLEHTLATDPLLSDRFASAERVTPVMTLGPLAVDARAAGLPGLLLAGDAAGFIDPMTGDGLRFAIEGARLAADTALDALVQPHLRAWRRLADRRRRRFAWKRGFDRLLRSVVEADGTSWISRRTERIVPAVLKTIVVESGDVRLARRLARMEPARS
jgi:flavin-dependent dehydrogenase